MQWGSVGEFLEMGGYGLYVWPSFGATIVCMVWEVIALRVRRAAAVEDIAMALPEGRTQT
jgi:heme exporter protein D